MRIESEALPHKKSSNALRLYIFTLVIVVVADLIGSTTLKVGSVSVVMLPMIWAIIIAAAFGAARFILPTPLKLELPLQFKAAGALQVGLLLFTAKTGLLVGGSLPVLLRSGWSLLFQELGHFAGTMILALPLALFLGIKKEAIGATFSIGREPSLAIIGERRGMNSPEGRGVLAEYLTGTLFDAILKAFAAPRVMVMDTLGEERTLGACAKRHGKLFLCGEFGGSAPAIRSAWQLLRMA